MAEYKDRYIIYKILVSKDCIRRRDRLQKLMYWSLEMRYQMEQCLQNKTNGPGQGNITDRLMPDVLRKYRCNAAHLNETSHFLEPYSFGYYPKKVPKTDNIEPKNLEQKDYSAEFSFTNLKTLNSRMCNDKCQNDSSKYCKNKALRSPRNCDECLCPFFYKGKKCFEFEKSKYCGDQKLKAISKQKNKFLDFKSDCYYIIKPKGKSKKVLLKFQAIGDAYWACDEDKLIEIRYSRDKSIEGVIPCGHIRNFTVKGYKGVSILVYTSELAYEFSKMAYEFKLKMEYREVRA
uniref:Astacin domain-containing protein n=1 Tax=Strongyloides papillosus TaxID=174720 RepID=A0A0N5CII7_STREA